MDPKGPAIIDFVEAAYNLQREPADWMAALMRAGAPILDRGLGVFAVTLERPPEPGPVRIDEVHLELAPAGLAERLLRLQGEVDMRLLWPISRPGRAPKTLSEVTADRDPRVFDYVMRHFDFAGDALGLSAFGSHERGLHLIVLLPERSGLTPQSRERWHMLAAHLGAGYRLRHAVRSALKPSRTDLPHGAEAVIDPSNFRVTDAHGQAKSRGGLEALREAALVVDRARGAMRRAEPEKALELWRALVRGRWSTIDWFDSDGRRYVLGVPNPLGVSDPRGLTEREFQVVAYAASGQINKMIGYHLGISKGRVSSLLSSAMRKLGVSNRAQLVRQFGDFSEGAQPRD
ncbi:MAG TPA: helix-turn-helix transcriptional regulator [Polyangiales bacterium]|nr:helix-turn-helix transcriptional regulator [Polyangiales bacterium]